MKARDEALLLLDLYRTFVVKPIEDKQSLEAAKVLRDLDGKTYDCSHRILSIPLVTIPILILIPIAV